jgi:predicted O-methyltransferase YrrM
MFIETVNSFAEHVQAVWLKLAALWSASKVARTPGYVFTADYSKPFTLLWAEYLSEFTDKPNVNFLEIGSFEGLSTIWLLSNVLTHPTATITCVDSFVRAGAEPRFDHNVQVSGLSSKVKKLKGKSEELLRAFTPETFDAIYVDGCHKALNVLMDAVTSWTLLKPQGILIFDDYEWAPHLPPLARPQMAIDLFLTTLESELTILHRGYQVIVRKR